MAGQKVPAGTYQEVERQWEVRLENEDFLPASCDGRVAIYVRRPLRWSEIKS